MTFARQEPYLFTFKLSDPRFQALIAAVIASVFLAFSPVSFFIVMLGCLVLFSPRASEIFLDSAANAKGISNNRLVDLDLSDALAWGTIVVLSLVMFMGGPLPTDDMLRHLTASEWGYDVTQHYGTKDFPHHWSWWWGWEKLLSWIYESSGKDLLLSSRIARAFMVLLCGVCLWLGFSRAGGKNRELAVLCFVYTMVFICWGRMVQGRPDLVMLCAIGLAAFCTSRTLWVVLMVPLIPAYWLSGVVASSAFMLRCRSHEDYVANLSAAFAVFCMTISFWFLVGGFQYFEIPNYVLRWIDFGSNRVGDLVSAAFSLMNPLRLATMVFCTMAIIHARDKFTESVKMRWEIMCWLVCPFLLALPDITAYISSICAVLVLVGLRLYALVPIKADIRKICLYAATLVSLYGLYQGASVNDAPLQTRVMKEMPDIPEKSRVLTPFNALQHLAGARYPQAVITPIFEIGALSEERRQVVQLLNRGVVQCSMVVGRYDYIVEDTMLGQPEPCLTLEVVAAQMRMWKVVGAPSN